MFSEELGPADAAPMLLLHGFLSSNVQWLLNQAELSRHHRLILAELVGHGRSEAPADTAEYAAAAAVAEIERIREAHGVDTWWVGGQSLGGAIAIHYCLAHADRVRGLIFTNSRAAFGIKRVGVSPDDGAPPPMTSTRDSPVHPINATRLDAELKAQLVAAADAIPLHVLDRYSSLRSTWDATEHLSQLSMPVLLVNGRWEKAFQPFVETARGVLPDLSVVTLEGGHAINAEQPAAFNQAVLEFTGTART